MRQEIVALMIIERYAIIAHVGEVETKREMIKISAGTPAKRRRGKKKILRTFSCNYLCLATNLRVRPEVLRMSIVSSELIFRFHRSLSILHDRRHETSR